MPTTFSGCCAFAAMSVIGIVDVFVAKTAPGFSMPSNSARTCRLMSTFSTTASITRSARPKPLQSVVAVMRASFRCISPFVIRRESTLRRQIFDAAL